MKRLLEWQKYELVTKEEDLTILEFPELRQFFNYDCGASALQSVLTYYGIEKREDELFKMLETVPVEMHNKGTRIAAIKRTAEYYGLECQVIEGMEISNLIELIDNGVPVIVLLQAWRDFTNLAGWRGDYKDGHYVVAIGHQAKKIIFEDPASFCRTYLSQEELTDRWHAVDDDNKDDPRSVGIVIYGTPTFKWDKCEHMD